MALYNRNGIRILGNPNPRRPWPRGIETPDIIAMRCDAHRTIARKGIVIEPETYQEEYRVIFDRLRKACQPDGLNIVFDESMGAYGEARLQTLDTIVREFLPEAKLVKLHEVGACGCCDEILFPAARDAGCILFSCDIEASRIFKTNRLYSGVRAIIFSQPTITNDSLMENAAAIADYCRAEQPGGWLLVDTKNKPQMIFPNPVQTSPVFIPGLPG